MITTGWDSSSNTNKSEILDVSSGGTCSDLPEFPLIMDRAVGANLNGTPALCGGYSTSYSEKCYKLTNGGWQEFASMKKKRLLAAGAMHEKKLHVFGGSDGSPLKTSEIISVDGGVEYGPDLPTAMWMFSITAINETVSILSGGMTNANHYTSETWFYNHETQVFSSGPNLLEARREHSSATIVDKVTKAKIPIITGGIGDGLSLKSTELLINGQWQSGP